MKLRLLVISFFFSFILISGCIDQQSTTEHDSEGVENNQPTRMNLKDIALTVDDLNVDMEMVFENYTKTPYNVTNMTGNDDLNWHILEGYFSSFVCNTSRIFQSILRFESNELATLNLQLFDQNLRESNRSEIPIEPVGQMSFLFKSNMSFSEGFIDLYVLNFLYDDIVVSLVGYATVEEDIIQYAEKINNNILLAVSS